MILKILKIKSHRPAGGFTMLEMMIIVVIIGIVAAMAAPTFFSSGPRLKARTEARNVLNFTRLARSNSISNGTQYGVYVDSANRRYLLFKDTNNPAAMSYEISDQVISGPVPLPADVTFGSSFANGTVVFLSTGRASQSGNYTFGIQGGGILYTVSVLASTGRSKLQ
jgi:type II secretory pathway pseudopilin PulG